MSSPKEIEIKLQLPSANFARLGRVPLLRRAGSSKRSEDQVSVYFDTKRRMNVVAKGFTDKGDPVQVVGDGILSRCIQHETDHLDGVLFIDRQRPEQRDRLLATIRAAAWYDGLPEPAVKVSWH